ncbi:MAG: site-2 protease family protein [Myxococcota bacterium]
MFDLPIYLSDMAVRMGIVLVGVMLCVSVHEFSRAMMAIHLGDNLAAILKRNTLNPVMHIHIISTLALPAGLVLLAMITGSQNVPFVAMGLTVVHNPLNFKHYFWGRDLSTRQAQWLIAVSGPIGNSLFALLCWVSAGLLVKMQWFHFYTYSPADALMHLVYLNVTLVIFNMLPIFPLDGAFIWPQFFSNRTLTRFFIIRPWISVTLTAVLILGGGSWIALLARRITHQMLAVFT